MPNDHRLGDLDSRFETNYHGISHRGASSRKYDGRTFKPHLQSAIRNHMTTQLLAITSSETVRWKRNVFVILRAIPVFVEQASELGTCPPMPVTAGQLVVAVEGIIRMGSPAKLVSWPM